jgi:cytochrome P450
MLLELSRNPEIQTKLRHEVQAMEHTIRSRGDSEFKASDFDAMPYLSAVMKVNKIPIPLLPPCLRTENDMQETLRYHPVVHNTFRQAIKDDLLPLSKPIITPSGEVLNEIPVPKGLKIITSIGGYNRFS